MKKRRKILRLSLLNFGMIYGEKVRRFKETTAKSSFSGRRGEEKFGIEKIGIF